MTRGESKPLAATPLGPAGQGALKGLKSKLEAGTEANQVLSGLLHCSGATEV